MQSGELIRDADGRRYMLKHALRAGAQAEVWTAVPNDSDRHAVVIKFGRSPDEGRAIERSVMLSAALHSGWMRPLAVGEHEAHSFAVFELASGGDLLSLVASEGPLKPRQAAQWAAELAEVVSSAHAVGICHRDIKPDNVVITPKGPRLIDLGVGLARGDRDETGPGRAAGWAAPESMVDGPDYPCAFADIYGLGGLLFWMLTGEAPNGNTPDEARARLLPAAAEVTRRIRHDHLKAAGVPKALADIALRCLEHDPANRPVQASALAGDLRAWLTGETPITNTRSRMLRRVRRTAPVALALVIGAVLGVSLGRIESADRMEAAHRAAVQNANLLIEQAQLIRDQADSQTAMIMSYRERALKRARAELAMMRYAAGRYGTTRNVNALFFACHLIQDPYIPATADWTAYEELATNRLAFAERTIAEAKNNGHGDHIFTQIVELNYAAWLYQEHDADGAIVVLDSLIPRLGQRLAADDPYIIGARELRDYAIVTASGRVPDEIEGSQDWVLRLVSNQIRLRGVDYEDWFAPPAPSWAGIDSNAIPQQRRKNLEFTAEVRRKVERVNQAIADAHPAVDADRSWIENWKALEAAESAD